MTLSGRRLSTSPAALVLLGAGPVGPLGSLMEEAGPPLAAVLGLTLAPPLPPTDPRNGLAGLAPPSPGAPARLVPLPLDPGQSLPDGSCWAEALGAWRQPTVLLLTAEQQHSGLPAAMVALLRQAGVPLAGLIQWGLPWEPQLRRREGLPWLGVLEGSGPADPSSPTDGSGLALALALGWGGLDLAPPSG